MDLNTFTIVNRWNHYLSFGGGAWMDMMEYKCYNNGQALPAYKAVHLSG